MDVAERADHASGSGTIYMYIEVGDDTERVAVVDVDIFGASGDLYSYFVKGAGG